MNLRVLEASNPADWDSALTEFPWRHRDVYFTSEWYRHWQRAGYGEGRALLIEIGDHRFFYPFLLRPIEGFDGYEGLFDVETAYGYGGVISSNGADDSSMVDGEVLGRFNITVDDWMSDQRVVCEFLRLSPRLNEKRLRSLDYHHVRTDLFRNVGNLSIEEIWTTLDSTTRTAIRKARRLGLGLDFQPHLDEICDFASIYDEAASRLAMAPFYHFSAKYFDSFAAELKAQGLLVFVRQTGEAVAGALWLIGDGTLHYYLGATRSHALSLRCSDMYMWGAIEFATTHPKLQAVHFGGSLGRHPDSLFRFKSKYADRQEPVFVGTRVHDATSYRSLVARWAERYPELVRDHSYKLLCYRVVPGPDASGTA